MQQILLSTGHSMLTSRSDFDPEDIDNGQQSSDDESENEGEVTTGREHYETVGCVKIGVFGINNSLIIKQESKAPQR
ncbi:MAG: hypothetical protein LBE64_09130 [Acinetobacter pittii]|jgi:hypothetical protein|nr:hypothetical protein [Acinetobacter pittii]